MKKLFAILLCAMMLAAMLVPASASGTGTSWGKVPKTTDAITLDGAKDAIYDKGLIIPIETVREANSELSSTGKAYFVWADGYLYVYAEVQDEWLKPVDKSLANHLVDGVELSMDWDNDGVDSGKYVTWYDGTIFRVNAFGKPENDYGAEIVAKKISDKSYSIEWKLTTPKEIKAGSEITMYMHINNNTEAGKRVMVRAPQSANSGSNNLVNTDYIVLSDNVVTAKAPETTKAPATTKAPTQTPATADTTIVAATVLLMAAAVALTMKKKAR
ncbi:MAG: hypothetical protein IKD37_07145 [Clostridia bacterium]|nr:hypothetical protein [Clostridia bacterium]